MVHSLRQLGATRPHRVSRLRERRVEVMQPFPNMPPRRPKREAALGEARRLLSVAGITEPPVDVERLSRVLGVRKIVPVGFIATDACLLPDRNGHTILIKRTSSERRQRFSIAHELGHILLRARATKFRGGNRERAAQEEKLCDEIAAELLMPQPLFEREMIRQEPSIEMICKLAKKFNTAIEPAAIRFGKLSRADIQVVHWEKQGNFLRAKWVSGARLVPYGSRRSVWDMTSGPCQAYHAGDEIITSYEAPRKGAPHLNLVCQSRAFDLQPFRFVLSLIQDESY